MTQYNISIYILVPIIIAVVSFFYAFTIGLVSKPKSKANKYIILFFLMVSFMYTIMILEFTVYFYNFNVTYIFYFFNYSATLFLFLFVQKSLIEEVNILKKYSLLFLPSLAFLFLTFYFIDDTYNGYLDHYKNIYHSVFKTSYEITLYVINILTIFKYKNSVKQTHSSLRSHQNKWVMFIVVFSIIFSIYPKVLALHSSYSGDIAYQNLDYVTTGIYAFIYFLILFTGVILYANKTQPIRLEVDNKKINKVPSKEQKKLYTNIIEELEANKTFINSNINLFQLASLLGESTRNISEAINICSDKNFYDLINSYRINEAITIFKKDKEVKYTIKEVMYQVGYNSKSSFNSAFKKYTRKSPSDYRKNIE